MIKCGKDRKISNVTGDGEEHSIIWRMFMAVTMESAIFMGKNLQNNRNSIVNATDLTLKQMLDISAKLVSEQEEISGLETIGWENHSWKYMSLIGDERIINLHSTKVYVFSDSVLCLGKIHQNPESNTATEERVCARCPQHMSTTTNTAQPQGLALCSRCHPAWASEDTPVGPGKDTDGTLEPGKRGGRGWPTTTAQREKCRTHQTVQNTGIPTNMVAEHVTIEEKLADEDSD